MQNIDNQNDFDIQVLQRFGIQNKYIDRLKIKDVLSISQLLSFTQEQLSNYTGFTEIEANKILLFCEKLMYFGNEAFDMYGVQNWQTQNSSQYDNNSLLQKEGQQLNSDLWEIIDRHKKIEIFGESSTGKTQFCYFKIVRYFQNNPTKQIIVIDTLLNFKLNRLQQICQNNQVDFNSLMHNVYYKSILEYDKLEKVISIIQSYSIIDIGLIVIDSLTNLFTIQNGNYNNVKSLIQTLEIIQNSNLEFFVTNQVRAVLQNKFGIISPVQDKRMKQIFKNRIELRKIYSLRKLKFKFQDLQMQVKFEINEKGIEFIECLNQIKNHNISNVSFVVYSQKDI